MKTLLSRLPVDPYIAAIVGMVALASVFPVHGQGVPIARRATTAAIALMFFLYGARLAPARGARRARTGGCTRWCLACTFLLFPLLGLAARGLAPGLLTPPLWTGLLLLCVVPSTVQSSIAFTSIARGNVPAAICAASVSNLLGIVLTPLLAGLLLSTQGGVLARGVGDIVLQLLLPFVAGQLRGRWIGGLVLRNKQSDRAGRSRLDPARGLRRVQRGRQRTASGTSSRDAAWLRCVIGRVLLAVMLWRPTGGEPAAGLQPGGQDRHRLLRLEEEPGGRPADGQRAVRRPGTRPDRAAADAVPPDPAHGLRRAGMTVWGRHYAVSDAGPEDIHRPDDYVALSLQRCNARTYRTLSDCGDEVSSHDYFVTVHGDGRMQAARAASEPCGADQWHDDPCCLSARRLACTSSRNGVCPVGSSGFAFTSHCIRTGAFLHSIIRTDRGMHWRLPELPRSRSAIAVDALPL